MFLRIILFLLFLSFIFVLLRVSTKSCDTLTWLPNILHLATRSLLSILTNTIWFNVTWIFLELWLLFCHPIFYEVYWCNFSLFSDTELCCLLQSDNLWLCLSQISFFDCKKFWRLTFSRQRLFCFMLHFLTVASTGLSGVSKHLEIVWYYFPFLQWFYFITCTFEIPVSIHVLFCTIVHSCPAESQTEPFNWVWWFTATFHAVVYSLENLWNCVPLEHRRLNSASYHASYHAYHVWNIFCHQNKF